MKIAEVRELTDKDLLERIEVERTALAQLKMNHSVTPLDNPTEIKNKRRTIARLLTEQTQRKLVK